jgi:diguanylate cyclase (GGDEF)-like protein/PAS domain S-box-containing protein
VFGYLHWDGVAATQVMLRDVTALKVSQHQIQRLSDRLALIIEGTGDGIWEWDIASDRFRFSGGFNKIIGHDAPSEASAAEWYRGIHPEDMHRVQLTLQECVKGRQPLHGIEFRIRSAGKTWKWVRARGVIVESDPGGQPSLMAGTLTDITIQKESDELAWKHSHLDPLTSLPNRRLFRQTLDFDIQKSRHAARRLALLFIDVDGFRYVNDLYGHEAGDLLLMETARRIRKCVAESATVARIGGDEFVVTLPELPRLEHVELVCEEVLAALSQRFSLGDNTTYVSASIGISLFPFDATEAEELLRKAEQAKNHAKRTGKNRFAYFRRELDEQAHTRLRLLSELRVALSLDQFQVHYQPIIDMRDRHIVKAEALLRWNHPVLGSVPPAQFIPMAEEFGLIASIGEWMCKQAITFCKQCDAQLGNRFQVGINMSPIQFMTDGGNFELEEHLAQAGLAGNRVVIEITEGVLLNKSDKVLKRFDSCRRAGIEIALDDFGTGYSSMSYLLKFDIDYIKIDKAFVQSINPSQDSRAIAETIIAMAHRLNKKVIAEGIETQEQWDYLALAGCDFAQGYLFSPALPPERFAELVSG